MQQDVMQFMATTMFNSQRDGVVLQDSSIRVHSAHPLNTSQESISSNNTISVAHHSHKRNRIASFDATDNFVELGSDPESSALIRDIQAILRACVKRFEVDEGDSIQQMREKNECMA